MSQIVVLELKNERPIQPEDPARFEPKHPSLNNESSGDALDALFAKDQQPAQPLPAPRAKQEDDSNPVDYRLFVITPDEWKLARAEAVLADTATPNAAQYAGEYYTGLHALPFADEHTGQNKWTAQQAVIGTLTKAVSVYNEKYAVCFRTVTPDDVYLGMLLGWMCRFSMVYECNTAMRVLFRLFIACIERIRESMISLNTLSAQIDLYSLLMVSSRYSVQIKQPVLITKPAGNEPIPVVVDAVLACLRTASSKHILFVRAETQRQLAVFLDHLFPAVQSSEWNFLHASSSASVETLAEAETSRFEDAMDQHWAHVALSKWTPNRSIVIGTKLQSQRLALYSAFPAEISFFPDPETEWAQMRLARGREPALLDDANAIEERLLDERDVQATLISRNIRNTSLSCLSVSKMYIDFSLRQADAIAGEQQRAVFADGTSLYDFDVFSEKPDRSRDIVSLSNPYVPKVVSTAEREPAVMLLPSVQFVGNGVYGSVYAGEMQLKLDEDATATVPFAVKISGFVGEPPLGSNKQAQIQWLNRHFAGSTNYSDAIGSWLCDRMVRYAISPHFARMYHSYCGYKVSQTSLVVKKLELPHSDGELMDMDAKARMVHPDGHRSLPVEKVPIVADGKAQAGIAWMTAAPVQITAMQRLDRELHELLHANVFGNRNNVRWDAYGAMCTQVSFAVSAMYQQLGLSHRDLHPHNILSLRVPFGSTIVYYSPYMNAYYRVPAIDGRVFIIIDFGLSTIQRDLFDITMLPPDKTKDAEYEHEYNQLRTKIMGVDRDVDRDKNDTKEISRRKDLQYEAEFQRQMTRKRIQMLGLNPVSPIDMTYLARILSFMLPSDPLRQQAMKSKADLHLQMAVQMRKRADTELKLGKLDGAEKHLKGARVAQKIVITIKNMTAMKAVVQRDDHLRDTKQPNPGHSISFDDFYSMFTDYKIKKPLETERVYFC